MRRPSVFGVSTRLPVLVSDKVRLRPRRLQDSASDYSWRRDTELCCFHAVTPILSSFEEYLKAYAEEVRYPGRGYRFAIETLDGKYIGNCSCFNVDEVKGSAELGIMIGDRAYWSHGYGADAVLTLLNYIFSQTKLERVYLKALDWNIRAQKCFKKCGFVSCGQLIYGDHSFIAMEICRSAKLQKQVK